MLIGNMFLLSLICCKARLITNDFYFVCLHVINNTMQVTTNETMAVTNKIYLSK